METFLFTKVHLSKSQTYKYNYKNLGIRKKDLLIYSETSSGTSHYDSISLVLKMIL